MSQARQRKHLDIYFSLDFIYQLVDVFYDTIYFVNYNNSPDVILFVQGQQGLPVLQLLVASGAAIVAPTVAVLDRRRRWDGAVVTVVVVVDIVLRRRGVFVWRSVLRLVAAAVVVDVVVLLVDAPLAEAALAGEGDALAGGEGAPAPGAREARLAVGLAQGGYHLG